MDEYMNDIYNEISQEKKKTKKTKTNKTAHIAITPETKKKFEILLFSAESKLQHRLSREEFLLMLLDSYKDDEQ